MSPEVPMAPPCGLMGPVEALLRPGAWRFVPRTCTAVPRGGARSGPSVSECGRAQAARKRSLVWTPRQSPLQTGFLLPLPQEEKDDYQAPLHSQFPRSVSSEVLHDPKDSDWPRHRSLGASAWLGIRSPTPPAPLAQPSPAFRETPCCHALEDNFASTASRKPRPNTSYCEQPGGQEPLSIRPGVPNDICRVHWYGKVLLYRVHTLKNTFFLISIREIETTMRENH